MDFLITLVYSWISCAIASFLIVAIGMPRTAQPKEWLELARICLLWGPGLLFPLLVVLVLYGCWDV